MSRRDQRSGDGRRYGSRKKQPLTLFQQVLALAAGRPVFTADYYAVDGGSGKVASWLDHNRPTHTLAQLASASQAALPAAHADFGGALCATFDNTAAAGAGTFYTSNDPGSAWKFTTDGGGCDLFLTMTQAATPAAASYVSSLNGNPYLSIMHGGTAAILRALIGNDAGAAVIDFTPAASLAVNTPVYYHLSYREGAPTPEAVLRRGGTIIASGDSATPPGSNNPASPLVLGRRANGTAPCGMRWRHLMFFPALSPAGIAIVQQYIQADTGIAA